MPINNITQTISTLPPAGSRGVDVQTQFVIKQEDFQDHLQGTTVAELNTLKTQINTTVAGMNDAVTNVNTKASEANASALSASNSTNTATTKAGEASTSASQASASMTKASQWADNNYNVEVEAGKYSAKHWSTVAQNATVNKVDKVPSTDNAIVRFDGTTGQVQNSGVTIDDIGNVGIGAGNLTINSGSIKGSHGAGNVASNFAAGDGALVSNTTGYWNTASGVSALQINTTGSHNTANGSGALQNNTTGAYNTANGSGALYSNTTGESNTANGVNALGNSTTGAYNTANGSGALQNNTTGNNNTANGYIALLNNTTFSNVSGLGYNSQVTGSNQVQLGDSATTTYVYGTVQNRSDLRDKADVRDTVLGLDFIKSLRPVDYKWDMREDYKTERPIAPSIEKPVKKDIPKVPEFTLEESESEEYVTAKAEYDAKIAEYNLLDAEAEEAYQLELAEYNRVMDEYKLEVDKWLEDNKLENIATDGSKKRNRYHQGFIAQEVQALGVEFGGIQDHSIKGGEDVLSIGYDEMIAPLVKAMQEMSDKMDSMQLEINELKGVK